VAAPAAHWEGDDELAGKYMLERSPLASASAMFERYRPIQHWVIRYFRPLSQDEILVTVHPESSRVMGFHHSLPEDDPGADLSEADARALASAFAGRFDWKTGDMDLKENRAEKKKARRDHTFVWEARSGDPRNIGEATFRVEVEVSGGIATSARGFWKLPETFTRSRERQNFLSIAAVVLRIAVLAGGLVIGLYVLVHKVRAGQVPWRPTLQIAIPIAVLSTAAPLLSLHLLLQNYPTAIPIETYRVMMFLVVFISMVFAFVMLAAAAAMMTSSCPGLLAAFHPAHRRVLARDAAIALAGGIGLGLLAHALNGLLTARFPAQALFSIGAPSLIASHAPSIAAAANAIRSVILFGGVLAIAGLVLRHRLAVALAVPFAMLSGDVRTPAEFALQYVTALAVVAAGVLFWRWFARDNYLAYAVALWVLALRGPLAELYDSPRQPHFWVLAGILAAGLIWAFLPLSARRPGDSIGA
jgi:hypothetical protein